jgi:hypothetical protein
MTKTKDACMDAVLYLNAPRHSVVILLNGLLAHTRRPRHK